MNADFLGERRRALEESFFAKRNQQLLEELRSQASADAQREQLIAASGIHDAAALDALTEVGLCSETIAALGLVPLVEVAWADHQMDDRERDAILNAATQSRLDEGSPGYRLLAEWLHEKPDSRLLDAWKDYVAALCQSLSNDARQALENELMGRAQQVAEAAGGILGFGNRMSEKEKSVLDELDSAFRC